MSGVYGELSELEKPSPAPQAARPAREPKKKATKPSDRQPVSQPANRPTEQPADQLADVDTLGPISGRSRSFYITLKVDHWLDEAVEYLKTKGLHKVDRSVLVNTLLHDPDLFKPASLDRIRPRLLAHLTNKFLKRD